MPRRIGPAGDSVAGLLNEVIVQQAVLLETLARLQFAISQPRPAVNADSAPAGQPAPLTKYPAGALLRVKDICGDRKNGQPGLLPIVGRTWLKWVEQGRVPQGILLGTHTRVWPVEQVLAVREGLGAFEGAHNRRTSFYGRSSGLRSLAE